MANDAGRVPYRSLDDNKWIKAAHMEDCTDPHCAECAKYRSEGYDKCGLCGMVDQAVELAFRDPRSNKPICKACHQRVA